MKCRSLWHRPAAAVRTRTSRRRGFSMTTSSIVIGWWGACRTAAFMVMSLVEVDVLRLGECRPALDVGSDVLAELLGRHRHRLDRLDRQALAQVRILQHRDLHFVEICLLY